MRRSSATCLGHRATCVRRRFARAIRSTSASTRMRTNTWQGKPVVRAARLHKWLMCRRAACTTERKTMSTSSDSNVRPAPDAELVTIADYVLDTAITSAEAYDTARYSLMDSLGCAMLALQYP